MRCHRCYDLEEEMVCGFYEGYCSCGCHQVQLQLFDDFDADELGLDPEEEYDA